MGQKAGFPAASTAAAPSRKRLDSWKAVAAHFGRDVTTVRRWERREGLPIHRLFHMKLGSIYAFTDELDAWWAARTARESTSDSQATASIDYEGAGRERAPSGPEPDALFAPSLGNEARQRARSRMRRAAAVAIALASAGLLAAVMRGPDALKSWRESSRRAGAAPATAATPGVAVLPLVDPADRGAEPYFVDGMTTAITAELAAIKSLKVIANTSAKRYRERTQPVSAIANELGVDWIVQGSVERLDERVRITVGLSRAEGERPLWSNVFERPIGNVLDLQAEIAQAVAGQILGPGAPARARRDAPRAGLMNLPAYELHLRGEFHVEQLNPVALTRAVDYFRQAVAADPNLAVAWAGLAKAELMQEFWGNAGFGERVNAVRHATLKALALDPDLAEAHDIMGRTFLIYDRDWAGAETAFRKAIAEAPSLAVAYNGYSILLQTLVRTDEAIAAAAKARELDPMTAWSWTEEGRAHYRARRYAEADARYQRALELDPSFVPALDRLVQSHLAQRRLPEARRTLTRLEQLPTARATSGLRAWLDALGDDPGRARDAAARLTHPYRILIALGDYDTAFADLERAFGDGSLAGFALGNPELDPVRADPRFARLVARFGLPVDRLVALGRVRTSS